MAGLVDPAFWMELRCAMPEDAIAWSRVGELTASATAITLRGASRQGVAIDAERANRFLGKKRAMSAERRRVLFRIRPAAVCRRAGTPCWNIWNNKRS
jgi:hypothetical protein